MNKRILLAVIITILLFVSCFAQGIEMTGKTLFHDRYFSIGFKDDYIYCGGLFSLQIFHIDENDSLALVNILDIGRVLGIAIDSSFMFLICDQGILSMDLSIPDEPVIVGQLDEHLNDIFDLRYANRALFITYQGGVLNSVLRVIDVSNPYMPVVRAGISIEQGFYSIYAGNNMLHILACEWDIQYTARLIYDISEPANSHLTYEEHFNFINAPNQISGFEQYGYLDYGQYTRIYNLDDPYSPVQLYDDSSFIVSDDITYFDTIWLLRAISL
jgi:hypothetical protein